MLDDFAMPDGLDEVGQRTHAAVVAFLESKHLTWTGGGCRFYSPIEWARRGELGADEALRSGKLKLVLVHDGGDPCAVFNPLPHRDAEELLEEVTDQLESAGTFPELCYEWCTLFWELPEAHSRRDPRWSLGKARRLRRTRRRVLPTAPAAKLS
jgi:hypothetical protein